MKSHKYIRWYMSLVKSALTRDIPDCYIEKHHIFPTSIFGKNKSLVKLTAKEHYIAHKLLYKIYELRNGVNSKNTLKMAKAFCWMATRDDVKFNSRRYAYCKKMASLSMIGDNNPSRKDGAFTKEHRKKLSQPGETHGMYGKKHTEEVKQKLRELAKNQIRLPVTDETRKKLSDSLKGREIHENTKRAVSEANRKRVGMKYNKSKLKGNNNEH
jgi:hypothetical protein